MWNRKTLIERGSRYYVVDTARIPDGSGGTYETMIFPADKNGKVTKWDELYMERYTSERAAETGHDRAVRAVDKHLPQP